MEAWWILTAAGDEDEALRSRLSQDLEKLKDLEAVASPWFRVQALPSIVTTEFDLLRAIEETGSTLRSPLAEGLKAEPAIRGDHAGQINVLILGKLHDPRSWPVCCLAAKLLRGNINQVGSDATLSIIGLLSAPTRLDERGRSEIREAFACLGTLMAEDILAERAFNRVLVVQDSNRLGNPGGFENLSVDPVPGGGLTQLTELQAQVALHLATGSSRLENQPRAPVYAVCGAAALTWDRDEELRRSADQLLERVKGAFLGFGPTTAEDVGAAVQGIQRTIAKEKVSARLAVAAQATGLSLSAQLWEGARERIHERSGATRTRRIGPWNLLRRRLLEDYFGVFLRRLPSSLDTERRRLQSDVDETLRLALESAKKELEQEAVSEIHGQATKILKGDYGPGRDLAHIHVFAGQVKRLATDGLSTLKATDLPPENVASVPSTPDVLRGFQVERSADPDEEWNALRRRLIERIRSHPLPMALLTRAVLLGMLLAILGRYVVESISPGLVNLESLASRPSLLSSCLFSLPLVGALWRYAIVSVNHLRRCRLEMAAFVLAETRRRVSKAIADQASEFYKGVQSHATDVGKWVEEFAESMTPEGDGARRSFTKGAFQGSVVEGLRVPGAPTGEPPTRKSPFASVECPGGRRPVDGLSDDDLRELLRTYLDTGGESQFPWRVVSRSIPGAGESAETKRSAREFTTTGRTFLMENLDRANRSSRLEDALDAPRLETLFKLAAPAGVLHHAKTSAPDPVEWSIRSRNPEDIAMPASGSILRERVGGAGSIVSIASTRPIDVTDLAIANSLRTWTTAPALTESSAHPVLRFSAATTSVGGETGVLMDIVSESPVSGVSIPADVVENLRRIVTLPGAQATRSIEVESAEGVEGQDPEEQQEIL